MCLKWHFCPFYLFFHFLFITFIYKNNPTNSPKPHPPISLIIDCISISPSLYCSSKITATVGNHRHCWKPLLLSESTTARNHRRHRRHLFSPITVSPPPPSSVEIWKTTWPSTSDRFRSISLTVTLKTLFVNLKTLNKSIFLYYFGEVELQRRFQFLDLRISMEFGLMKRFKSTSTSPEVPICVVGVQIDVRNHR